jgi:putative hemolysin
VQRADGSWSVDGLLAAEELKGRLGLRELPNEAQGDYQTVGGLVMDQLGRIPVEGDRFEWGGFSFEVLDMDGNRVDKVLVEKA